MCLQFGFVIFWRKDFGAKAVHKMLVKLTPDVLTKVTLGKYVAGLIRNNICANFAQNIFNRLTYSSFLSFYHFSDIF
jgi:hypothetical protein